MVLVSRPLATKPIVSVLLPVFNAAAYVEESVRSILAQTWRDLELIVIDDGSTDATPAAARPYLADPRVKYVRSDRLGQSRPNRRPRDETA